MHDLFLLCGNDCTFPPNHDINDNHYLLYRDIMWSSFRLQKNHQANEQSFLYQHACQSIDAGDTKQALAALNKMQRKNPNDPRYMYGLGKLYTQQQQRCLAYHWYLKSAEQGDIGAQTNLGIMYENGIGTEINLKKARYWYKKAVEQGSEEAQERLADLSQ